jgi:superfamily II DNA or RNA helicase
MDSEQRAPAAPRLGFDRGTIVSDGESLWSGSGGEFDPAGLPGMRWDPRVGRFRAPARCWAAIAAQLARAGVPFEDRVLARGRGPRPKRGPELRPYQAAALDAWRLAGRRGVVVLPTGSGKTLVALAAIASEGRRTLCLVPTRVLLDQWRRVIARELGLEAGLQGDGERSVAPVTVATFESAWRHMAELGDRFELLVVDEVHHFGAGVRDEALEMCIAPLRLGLTATAPEERAARRLEDLVGPQVFELAVADLAGRWLAELELVELRLDLSPSEREEHDKAWAAFRRAHEEFRDLVPGGGVGRFRALGRAHGSRAGRAARLAPGTGAARADRCEVRCNRHAPRATRRRARTRLHGGPARRL